MFSLRSQKDKFSDRKEINRTMESNLEGTINYPQIRYCTLDAAKQNKKLRNRLL